MSKFIRVTLDITIELKDSTYEELTRDEMHSLMDTFTPKCRYKYPRAKSVAHKVNIQPLGWSSHSMLGDLQ